MNESISSPNSANDIFVEIIQHYLGTTVSDSFLFVAVMGILFAAIFMFMTMFMNTRAGVRFVVAYTPVLLIDGLKSFGTYTFKFPFFEFTIEHFVMTFKLIEYIFTFKIFTPILDDISTFQDFTTEPSIWIVFISWMYSFGDSIIQIILFVLAAYSLITLYENWKNIQIQHQMLTSIVFGFIPVFLYAYLVSNPFHEYELSQLYIVTLTNFFFNATWLQLGFFLTLAIISFFIIFIIILMITQFVLSTFITFSPKGKSLDFTTSFESVALLLTIFYSFLFLMHPEYTWYNIMLVILIWTGFKHFLDTIVSEANLKNTDRRRQVMQARRIAKEIKGIEGHSTSMIRSIKDPNDSFSLTILVPLILGILMILTGYYIGF